MRFALPLLLATLLALAACGHLPPPRGSHALYDFDTVYFHGEVGGVTPWQRADREAITRAVLRREARWDRENRRRDGGDRVARAQTPRKRARKAPARRRSPAPPRGARTARAKPRVAASPPRSTSAPPRRAASPPRSGPAAARPEAPPAHRPLPARIARASKPAAAATAPAPGDVRRRMLLGDGSVSGELLAAAQRLVGIRGGFGERPLLEHLLLVAAVDLPVTAPAHRYAAEVFARLSEGGRAFSEGPAEPGDLAFFHGVADLDGDGTADDRYSLVAVVEAVRSSGTVLLIGDPRGVVERFVMDPARPWVLRDEATGEQVNSPIRARSLDDGPETPALAGALFAGYARP